MSIADIAFDLVKAAIVLFIIVDPSAIFPYS